MVPILLLALILGGGFGDPPEDIFEYALLNGFVDDGDDSDDDSDDGDDGDDGDDQITIAQSWTPDEDRVRYDANIGTGQWRTIHADIVYSEGEPVPDVTLSFNVFDLDNGWSRSVPHVLAFEASSADGKMIDTVVPAADLGHCHSAEWKHCCSLGMTDWKGALSSPRETAGTKETLARLQSAAETEEADGDASAGDIARAVKQAKERLEALGDDARVVSHYDGTSINYLVLLSTVEHAALLALAKGIELIIPTGPAPTRSVTVPL